MDLTNNQVYNIFLCDDNIEHLHSLSHTILQLNTEHYIQLTQFSSSQELLDYLYKTDNINEHFPDLILMDIEMPGIDGITLGQKIKKISSDIRLVFVTAFAEYAKAPKNIIKSGDIRSNNRILMTTGGIFLVSY